MRSRRGARRQSRLLPHRHVARALAAGAVAARSCRSSSMRRAASPARGVRRQPARCSPKSTETCGPMASTAIGTNPRSRKNSRAPASMRRWSLRRTSCRSRAACSSTPMPSSRERRRRRVLAAYARAYAGSPFVRDPGGKRAQLRAVVGTNDAGVACRRARPHGARAVRDRQSRQGRGRPGRAEPQRHAGLPPGDWSRCSRRRLLTARPSRRNYAAASARFRASAGRRACRHQEAQARPRAHRVRRAAVLRVGRSRPTRSKLLRWSSAPSTRARRRAHARASSATPAAPTRARASAANATRARPRAKRRRCSRSQPTKSSSHRPASSAFRCRWTACARASSARSAAREKAAKRRTTPPKRS